MVVVAPQQHRLQSGGWFARAFLVTAGIACALLCVVVGLWLANNLNHTAIDIELRKAIEANSALTAKAKQLALPRLEQYGVLAISDDAGVVEDGGDVVLVGTARVKGGGLQQFLVRYHVAAFDKKQTWSLRSIIIDGHEKHSHH